MDHTTIIKSSREYQTPVTMCLIILFIHNVNSSWFIKSLVPTIVMEEHNKWVDRSDIV